MLGASKSYISKFIKALAANKQQECGWLSNLSFRRNNVDYVSAECTRGPLQGVVERRCKALNNHERLLQPVKTMMFCRKQLRSVGTGFHSHIPWSVSVICLWVDLCHINKYASNMPICYNNESVEGPIVALCSRGADIDWGIDQSFVQAQLFRFHGVKADSLVVWICWIKYISNSRFTLQTYDRVLPNSLNLPSISGSPKQNKSGPDMNIVQSHTPSVQQRVCQLFCSQMYSNYHDINDKHSNL